MQFNEQKSIYLQIADYICDKILDGTWPDGQRIPSIRDMAVQLEVNPNTVTRTYTMLLDEGTLQNKRGIGYFTGDDARRMVLEKRRNQFLEQDLPALFKTMMTLDIGVGQVGELYMKYLEEQNHEDK